MHIPFTAGPWKILEDGEANRYVIVDASGQWLMSLLHNGQQMTAVQLANLRLASEAPALFAALDSIAEGRVTSGEFTHAQTVLAYQELARHALATLKASTRSLV